MEKIETNNRYQLVAVDVFSGEEYIIPLKEGMSNNKKTSLSIIDFGTTCFKNERHLTYYLVKKDILKEGSYAYKITYRNKKMTKEIPCIFDNKKIHDFTDYKNNRVHADKLVGRKNRKILANEVMEKVKDYVAFRYFSDGRIRAMNTKNSGNYNSDRVFNVLSEYHLNYNSPTNHNSALYEDCEENLIKCLENYKEFRTLYINTREMKLSKSKEEILYELKEEAKRLQQQQQEEAKRLQQQQQEKEYEQISIMEVIEGSNERKI